MKTCTDRMSKLPGKYLLTFFVASLIAMPSAQARLTAQHSQLWSQDSPGIGGMTEPGDWFGHAVSACDYNNDGQEDLAIGVPLEDLGIPGSADEGAVNVIYGGNTNTGTGLSSVGSQLLTFSFDAPLNLSPEPYDYFGESLASGDFNGDGYCDLAVGVSRRDVEGKSDAGAVYVIYGAAVGLDENHKQFFSQAGGLIGGNPEQDDQFGKSLAAGDFDGNGKDDLAVGVPGESIGSTDGAGLVIVIYAANDSTGLNSRNNQGWTQGVDLNNSAPEEYDRFGQSLATGDFDDDGKDDLVVGVPYENIGDTQDAGVVHVIYGTGTGLNAAGSQIWAQGGQIQDVPEFGDAFGYSLAAGDFDGNGKDDLAVGVPYEDHTAFQDGVVHVIYGQSNGEGLGDFGDQLWSQAGDILGDPESGDNFGRTLTAGDFDADLTDDLAVGAILEDLGTIENTGVVNVIYGSVGGLSMTGNQLWSQDGGEGGDIPGEPEAFDFFGAGITAGDFDGNGRADLAVGASGQGTYGFGGEVSVIYAMKDYGSLGLYAASQTVSEGDSVMLTITRTGGSQEDVSVTLTTSGGSATSEDYTPVSTVVAFADGEIQKSVTIPVYDDELIENKENFWVTISNPQGGASLAGGATSLLISILDKQSCEEGQTRYEVPAPKSYPGKFYCAASEYVKAGDWTGGDLGVIVEPSGWLMYSAPSIYLYPGFRVEAGGELHLGYPIHP